MMRTEHLRATNEFAREPLNSESLLFWHKLAAAKYPGPGLPALLVTTRAIGPVRS